MQYEYYCPTREVLLQCIDEVSRRCCQKFITEAVSVSVQQSITKGLQTWL